MKKAIIFDFKRTIYDPDLDRLLPGTKGVLRELKEKGYSLFLVSHGSYRKTMINDLGIEEYFDEVVVTQDKSVEDFERVITKNGVDTENCFVVGDRVRGEIKIGNILGLKSVWLKRGLFAQELPTEPQEVPDFTALTLKEVLKIVP